MPDWPDSEPQATERILQRQIADHVLISNMYNGLNIII